MAAHPVSVSSGPPKKPGVRGLGLVLTMALFFPPGWLRLYHIGTVLAGEPPQMTSRLFAILLGAGLAILSAAPASAKPVHHVAHHASRRGADVRYAQTTYDYRSASSVREEFLGAPRTRWYRDPDFDRREFYRGWREGTVVEDLKGDFTGGVGYGANGDVPSFVDGYGQTHFFVGSFRRNAPMRFGAPRITGPGFRRF